jgi:hypothetical protein
LNFTAVAPVKLVPRACNPILELIYTHDPLVKNINTKELKLSGLPGSTSSLSAVQGMSNTSGRLRRLCSAPGDPKASEQAPGYREQISRRFRRAVQGSLMTFAPSSSRRAAKASSLGSAL